MTEPVQEPLSAPTPDEVILAQFVSDSERRGATVLDEYVRRYPPLAEEFRSLAASGQHDRAA